MQRLTEETRYDDARQRQIIALAAEMQRLEQEGATLAQLEARALDAGIDPKYVRMAAGQVPTTAVVPGPPELADRAWHRNNEFAIVTSVLFVMVHVVCIYQVMQSGASAVPISVYFAFAMGFAFSRNMPYRLGAIAALTGSTVAATLFYLLLQKVGIAYSPHPYWVSNVWSTFLLELMVLTLGLFTAAVGRWFFNSLDRRVK